uniref:Uncharacterized protein n=1 Tax=Alexandrium monilatum TaxID=311494 RepID=A0A7S4QYG4_9DINO
MELDTFIGEWRDSMGNRVNVDWACPGNRGGQLEVLLTKSGRDPIRLNVKRYGNGRFTCGHYDLDESESGERRIVWQDAKNHRNFSTWERVGEPPPRGDHWKGSSSRWRGNGWHDRDWSDGSWHSSGRRWGRRDDGRRDRGRSRSEPGCGDRGRGSRDRNDGDCGEWGRRDDRGRPREREASPRERQPGRGGAASADAPSSGAPPEDGASAPSPPAASCPPPWAAWGSHAAWGGHSPQGPGFPPPCPQPQPQPHTSVWSGAPTPGAWVPPTGAPPPAPQPWPLQSPGATPPGFPGGAGPAPQPAEGLGGPPVQPAWGPAAQGEAELYRALREKYAGPSPLPPPERHPMQPQPMYLQEHPPGRWGGGAAPGAPAPRAEVAPPGDWHGARPAAVCPISMPPGEEPPEPKADKPRIAAEPMGVKEPARGP